MGFSAAVSSLRGSLIIQNTHQVLLSLARMQRTAKVALDIIAVNYRQQREDGTSVLSISQDQERLSEKLKYFPSLSRRIPLPPCDKKPEGPTDRLVPEQIMPRPLHSLACWLRPTPTEAFFPNLQNKQEDTDRFKRGVDWEF